MKRNVVALGASVLALALGAGPAQAAPGATQSVNDTTGAAQVGAVAVNAPVRVASDGDSQPVNAAAAAPQTTSDSTGGAQVSSVGADAPVRVLSHGNDAAPADSGSSSAAADQTTAGSSGTAQVGSPSVSAPVRVASDGDNSASESAGASAGPQAVGNSGAAAQVGSPTLFAPVRVLSADQASGGTGPGLAGEVADLVATIAGDRTPGRASGTPSEQPGAPTPGESRGLVDGSSPDTQPAVNLESGGAPDDGGPGSEAGDVSSLGVAAAGTLPLTGGGFVAVVGMGLSLLLSGAALRRTA